MGELTLRIKPEHPSYIALKYLINPFIKQKILIHFNPISSLYSSIKLLKFADFSDFYTFSSYFEVF